METIFPLGLLDRRDDCAACSSCAGRPGSRRDASTNSARRSPPLPHLVVPPLLASRCGTTQRATGTRRIGSRRTSAAPDGRMGSRLPAPQGRRSLERALLVSAGGRGTKPPMRSMMSGRELFAELLESPPERVGVPIEKSGSLRPAIVNRKFPRPLAPSPEFDYAQPLRIPAVHALVAGAAADHDRAARRARRRVFLVLNRRERRRRRGRVPAARPAASAAARQRRRGRRRSRRARGR